MVLSLSLQTQTIVVTRPGKRLPKTAMFTHSTHFGSSCKSTSGSGESSLSGLDSSLVSSVRSSSVRLCSLWACSLLLQPSWSSSTLLSLAPRPKPGLDGLFSLVPFWLVLLVASSCSNARNWVLPSLEDGEASFWVSCSTLLFCSLLTVKSSSGLRPFFALLWVLSARSSSLKQSWSQPLLFLAPTCSSVVSPSTLVDTLTNSLWLKLLRAALFRLLTLGSTYTWLSSSSSLSSAWLSSASNSRRTNTTRKSPRTTLTTKPNLMRPWRKRSSTLRTPPTWLFTRKSPIRIKIPTKCAEHPNASVSSYTSSFNTTFT